MVLCLFRAIYQGFSKCSIWIMLVFLSNISISFFFYWEWPRFVFDLIHRKTENRLRHPSGPVQFTTSHLLFVESLKLIFFNLTYSLICTQQKTLYITCKVYPIYKKNNFVYCEDLVINLQPTHQLENFWNWKSSHSSTCTKN